MSEPPVAIPPTIAGTEPSAPKLLLRALRGETVARPPIWLMRQAGRYLPEYRATRAKAGGFLDLCYTPELAAEVTLQPLRRYALDAAILFADLPLVADALGQKLSYREGEGPRLDPIRDAAAMSVLSLEGLHRRLAPVYETVRLLARALPPEVALIGFAGAPWTLATYMVEGGGSADHAHTKRWAFGDPPGFGRLIDLLVEAIVEYLDAQVQAGAEVVQLFDSWAGVLPAPAFRRWCIEPVTSIVEKLRARHPGLPIIAFPRGAGVLYEGFAAATGVSAVSLDSTVPLDFAATRVQIAGCVQGNLDPQMLVTGGAALRVETARILAALSGGPHIFNLGHGIVQDTPPAHVAALVEQVRGWTRP